MEERTNRQTERQQKIQNNLPNVGCTTYNIHSLKYAIHDTAAQSEIDPGHLHKNGKEFP